ncbi:hypothetical protein CK203_102338 [Vitis vinifera]|uniref:Retrotransposon gag domain-containing protein n=1 Tax=Vitis vinifera TaxID=29760 RepID=A0A438BR12_VITVI|nr:hypothetical protein CK203_102338 [Vitis vinifera]
MQENESFRDFMKRFKQVVLQVESCSMDTILQIFKRNIYPGTPFFESLAKKLPTTMDDLFKPANKYSMLEDDIWVATQLVLVTIVRVDMTRQKTLSPQANRGKLTRGRMASSSGQSRSRQIQLNEIGTKAAPKVVINYIHGGLIDERYNSKQKRQRLLHATSGPSSVPVARSLVGKDACSEKDGTSTSSTPVGVDLDDEKDARVSPRAPSWEKMVELLSGFLAILRSSLLQPRCRTFSHSPSGSCGDR